ncbi:hypothetical protein ACX0KM_09550 [Pseudomonas promysalinigenes]
MRNASRNDPVQRIIQELDASGTSPLTGRAAEISHVTELAANFEATTHCLIEMARQFLQGPLVSGEEAADLFVAGVYLLACSMSCIFYRFNNGRRISKVLVITTQQAADLRALYHNYFLNGWNSDYTNLFVKGLPQRPEFRAYS